MCVVQGGLWRLTGQQIAGAAAEGEAGGTPPSSKGGAGGGEGGGDDVRGPHASLAVKLQVSSQWQEIICSCIGHHISFHAVMHHGQAAFVMESVGCTNHKLCKVR